MSTIKTQFYKDIDLTLSPHPLTGDIARKFDDDAIKRSIKHLMLLEKWDKPFDSDVHGHTSDVLFETPIPIAKISIIDNIKWVIRSFEPRVDVKSVEVEISADETAFNINIAYTIKSLRLDSFTSFTIQRVR